MIAKKAEAKVIYEDAAVMAVLSEEPTIFGHVLVFPKKHYSTFEEVENNIVTQLFYVASYAATAIFEGLGAEGTNLVICSGKDSSKKYDHIVIDVLPRKTNDGLNLKWDPKRLSPEDMDKVVGKIKDKADLINLPEQEKKPKAEPVAPDADEMTYSEDNYVLRMLRRIP
jgi:histidine triad (HIT) family protein